MADLLFRISVDVNHKEASSFCFYINFPALESNFVGLLDPAFLESNRSQGDEI